MCEYCQESAEPLSLSKVRAVIQGTTIKLEADGSGSLFPELKKVWVDINYCPMCGRNLREWEGAKG